MLRPFQFAVSIALLACFGCGSGSLASGGGDKVTLRLKLDKGKKFQAVGTTAMTQNMGTVNSDTTSTVSSSYEVLSNDANGIKVHMTLDDIKIDSKSNPAIANMSQSMKGTSVDTTYDELGNAKETAAGGKNSQLAQMMGGASAAVGFLGVTYPKEAVGPGSTWSSSIDFGKMVSSMMPGAQATGLIPVSFKVTDITNSGGKQVVNLDYTIKGTTEMTIMGQKTSLQMDSTGKISVDAATGLPITESAKGSNTIVAGANTIKQEMNVHLKVSG